MPIAWHKHLTFYTAPRAVIHYRPCNLGAVFSIMKPPKINTDNIQYINITKHWKRIKPIVLSLDAENIWMPNMFDYQEQRNGKLSWRILTYKKPRHFDGCDWRFERTGRHPEWWDFVCHSACHFLVDLNLYAAAKVFPKFQWRIVTQRQHSTVWNGDVENPVLFDMNFLALGIPAKESWSIASKGRMLKPFKPLNQFRYFKPFSINEN